MPLGLITLTIFSLLQHPPSFCQQEIKQQSLNYNLNPGSVTSVISLTTQRVESV